MTALAIVRDERTLEALAEEIRGAWEAARRRGTEAVEAYFVVGRCLAEARARLASDTAYGRWRAAQAFPFNRHRAYVLLAAAMAEPAVRRALASQLAGGQEPNIEAALWTVRGTRPKVSEAMRARYGAPGRLYQLIACIEDLRRVEPGVLAADLVDANPAHLLDSADYLDELAASLRAIAAGRAERPA